MRQARNVRELGRPGLLGRAAVTGVAVLALGMFAGVAEASPANVQSVHETHKVHKGTGGLILPKVKHPTVRGVPMTFIFVATPNEGVTTELLDIAILRKWGAHVKTEFATSTAVAFADILHANAPFLSESITGVINSEKTGIHLVVMGLATPREDFEFVARPGINSLSQLAGKTIGVFDMQNQTGVQVDEILKMAHLSLNQVTIANIGGQANRLAALLSGRIDACSLGHAPAAELPKSYKVLYDWTKSDPKTYTDVWSTPNKYLKSHPKVIIALDEATLLGFRYYNQGHDKELFHLLHAVDSAYKPGTVIPYLNEMRNLGGFPDGSMLSASSLKVQEKLNEAVKAITSAPPLSVWAQTRLNAKAKRMLGKAAY